MKKRLIAFYKNYWPELILHFPIVLCMCSLFYGKTYFESWQNFVRMSVPWFLLGIVIGVGNNWVLRTMRTRFEKLDDWPKRIAFNLLGFLFFTVGANFLFWLILKKLPYPELVLSDKLFYTIVVISIGITFFFATTYEGITYFEKWKAALTETEKLEKLNLESQISSLQSQLNPHFLFNSFNVLSSLIAESPRRAEDFVDELSNVYRYLLRSNEQELASVGEELRFIRSFFHLLETRHERCIALKINAHKDIFDKKLPALALQILVENVVKHNEVSPEKPLLIEIYEVDETRLPHKPKLIVRNNIQRKATRPHSNNVGLDNLRQRYELLGMTGFEVQNDGRYFTVTLPIV